MVPNFFKVLSNTITNNQNNQNNQTNAVHDCDDGDLLKHLLHTKFAAKSWKNLPTDEFTENKVFKLVQKIWWSLHIYAFSSWDVCCWWGYFAGRLVTIVGKLYFFVVVQTFLCSVTLLVSWHFLEQNNRHLLFYRLKWIVLTLFWINILLCFGINIICFLLFFFCVCIILFNFLSRYWFLSLIFWSPKGIVVWMFFYLFFFFEK